MRITLRSATRAPAPNPAGDTLLPGSMLMGRRPMSDDMTCRSSSQMENPVIKGKIFRILMLVAGATGLLALFETAAHAGTNLNHCEPLQRI